MNDFSSINLTAEIFYFWKKKIVGKLSFVGEQIPTLLISRVFLPHSRMNRLRKIKKQTKSTQKKKSAEF